MQHLDRKTTRAVIALLACGAATVGGLSVFVSIHPALVAACVVSLLISLLSWGLISVASVRTASLALVYLHAADLAVAGQLMDPRQSDSTLHVLMLFIGIAGLALGGRHALQVAIVAIIADAAAFGALYAGGTPLPQLMTPLFMTWVLHGLMALLVVVFTIRVRTVQDGLQERVSQIEAVLVSAARVADGDLTSRVDVEDEALQESMDTMLDGLKSLVSKIQRAAAHVQSAAREIAATARENQRGILETTSSVQETRQQSERLAQEAKAIAAYTENMERAAQELRRTQGTSNKLHSELNDQLQGIRDVLELIRSVARRSRILSLNASIEATRAGQSESGFMVIAREMRRLNEQVVQGTQSVHQLVDDVESYGASSQEMQRRATDLATTTESMSQTIRARTSEQQAAAREVLEAMTDFESRTLESDAAALQTLEATTDLVRVAHELDTVVDGFRLGS